MAVSSDRGDVNRVVLGVRTNEAGVDGEKLVLGGDDDSVSVANVAPVYTVGPIAQTYELVLENAVDSAKLEVSVRIEGSSTSPCVLLESLHLDYDP
jgi:hypothetical protein